MKKEAEKPQENNMPVPRMVLSHLIAEKNPALGELLYAGVVFGSAIDRWITRAVAVAVTSNEAMGVLDGLVLLQVHNFNTEKVQSDIAFMLNIEDSQKIYHSLRKLVELGLIQSIKRGKVAFYSATPDGEQFCQRFSKVCDQCLSAVITGITEDKAKIHETAMVMIEMSNGIDTGSRTAQSMAFYKKR